MLQLTMTMMTCTRDVKSPPYNFIRIGYLLRMLTKTHPSEIQDCDLRLAEAMASDTVFGSYGVHVLF